MLCACQQAEPILMSTPPHHKSQQRITGYTTRSASPDSHSNRQSLPECDADHHGMTAGTAADQYRGSQWLTPAPVTGAVPGKPPAIEQVDGLSPSPASIWSLHLLQPSGSQVPRERFSNPTLGWMLEAKMSCLFSNFYCFSMFSKMWTGFLQPGFLCSRPIHLTFCKQFCFGGWMKCIYLAAQATWVATAKQRNYLCSQQREETANYAILDKYQLNEHVLLTPRPLFSSFISIQNA